jgi:hypothetical protein
MENTKRFTHRSRCREALRPSAFVQQNHRSQPAMAGEFLSEILSVNTAIAGAWIQPFA